MPAFPSYLVRRVDGSPLRLTGLRRFMAKDALRVAEITALSETLAKGLAHGGYGGPEQALLTAGSSYLFWTLMAKMAEIGAEASTPNVEDLAIVPAQTPSFPKRILTREEDAVRERWKRLFGNYAFVGTMVGVAGVLMNFSPADAFVFYGLNAYLCHRNIKKLETGKIKVIKTNQLKS